MRTNRGVAGATFGSSKLPDLSTIQERQGVMSCGGCAVKPHAAPQNTFDRRLGRVFRGDAPPYGDQPWGARCLRPTSSGSSSRVVAIVVFQRLTNAVVA